MKEEERNQTIKELMISIRRNTVGSKCIDVFENLLYEIPDKEVVDTAVADMHRFVGEFSRLCSDVDNMKHIDFIAKMLTYEFIQPSKFFVNSKKNANLYLVMSDILKWAYAHPVYEIADKEIVLSNVNRLGDIWHKESWSAQEVVMVTNYFGNVTHLSVDDVKDKFENARKVILLYNYMPAIVKAFIQTKRRSLKLDKNSTKF